MKYTLGVDFGGSSSKATLLCETGKVAATSSIEYPSYYPRPGYLEQNAEELFNAFVFNVKAVLEKSGIDPGDISALAIDAATHMAVLCGADGRPLRNFIHWSDSRCTKQVKFLKENYSDLIKSHSVNSVSAAWTLPQLLWLQENEPDILRKTERVYFVKDYIRHKVTGDFCTDTIEAMGPMLADDNTGEWCRELCDIAGININSLPEIKKPTDTAGYVSADAAAITGLKAGTPVIVGATDTVMEVYASGAVSEGTATVKLATAGRICPITTHAIPSHQFFNYKHVIPGMWYPGTGTRSCAASYRWYRDVLGGSDYETLNHGAEIVPAGSEGLVYLPFLQGEMTPYYDDTLCASFTGVRSYHTKGHFTRAVLEGVSYSMRDCMQEIKAQNININQFRLIGGGAKGRLWRQILADVLATPLTCTMDNDSSLGSAMLAGVSSGMFGSFEESVEKCVVVADKVHPIEENIAIYDRGFAAYKALVSALSEVYHKNTNLI